jgi:hypothetical protein
MNRGKEQQVAPPLAYQLRLLFGRPFGLRWVPDNHLGVVYRMEMYHGLRGPGFFRIDPWQDTVKDVVSLNPDFIETRVENLNTRDAVQLGLRVALAYVFDPRYLPREKALVFIKWPSSILRAIVSDFANSALLNIVPKYHAEQICRGELFETIQDSLEKELKVSLDPLAIRPTFAMVLEAIVPPALQDTFTAVANRAAYTHDLSLYESFELDEIKRRELNSVLRDLPGGIRYLNVSAPEEDSQWQDGRRTSEQTLRGTARHLPSQSPDIDIEDDLLKDVGTSPRSHLSPPPPTPDAEAEENEPPKQSGISRKSHLSGQ